MTESKAHRSATATRSAGSDAIARVLDHAARLAEDAGTLSVRMRPILDLMREADAIARTKASRLVSAEHVQAAIDAQLRAGPELLEPIMKVDVFVPDANVGDVIGDLNRRRGIISGQEPTPANVRIRAEVPLSEMFGYIGDLRSNTQGRGQFTMEFARYASVPKNIVEKVKEQVKEREAQK